MTMRAALTALLVTVVSLPAGAAQWLAKFGEVGPLKIGMSLAEANSALGSHFAKPKVPGVDPTGSCYYVGPVQPGSIWLMFIAGDLARIDVTARGVETNAGVSVGDLSEAVGAAYASDVTRSPAFLPSTTRRVPCSRRSEWQVWAALCHLRGEGRRVLRGHGKEHQIRGELRLNSLPDDSARDSPSIRPDHALAVSFAGLARGWFVQRWCGCCISELNSPVDAGLAAQPGVPLMFGDRRLARVEIGAHGAETVAAIGVGAAEAAVFRAYGSRVVQTPHARVARMAGTFGSGRRTAGTVCGPGPSKVASAPSASAPRRPSGGSAVARRRARRPQ